MSEFEDFITHHDPFLIAERQAVQRLIVKEPNRGLPLPVKSSSYPYADAIEELKAATLAASLEVEEPNVEIRAAASVQADSIVFSAIRTALVKTR